MRMTIKEKNTEIKIVAIRGDLAVTAYRDGEIVGTGAPQWGRGPDGNGAEMIGSMVLSEEMGEVVELALMLAQEVAAGWDADAQKIDSIRDLAAGHGMEVRHE